MAQEYYQPSFLLLIQMGPTGYPFQGSQAFRRFRDPDVSGFAKGSVSQSVDVGFATTGVIGFAFEKRGLVLSTCIRSADRGALPSRLGGEGIRSGGRTRGDR